MRNNNKPIIIHSLIERKLNQSESGTAKYDYFAELTVAEKRLLKLQQSRANQLKKEKKGQWVAVVTEHGKFQIFVEKGHNIEKAKNCFIEKLNKRAKK